MIIENITVLIRGVAQNISFGCIDNIWYVGGELVHTLGELQRKFGIDEESITMLVLKYGTPNSPYREHTASPYTPRNIRKDLAKSARLELRSLWHPYHA